MFYFLFKIFVFVKFLSLIVASWAKLIKNEEVWVFGSGKCSSKKIYIYNEKKIIFFFYRPGGPKKNFLFFLWAGGSLGPLGSVLDQGYPLVIKTHLLIHFQETLILPCHKPYSLIVLGPYESIHPSTNLGLLLLN